MFSVTAANFERQCRAKINQNYFFVQLKTKMCIVEYKIVYSREQQFLYLGEKTFVVANVKKYQLRKKTLT